MSREIVLDKYPDNLIINWCSGQFLKIAQYGYCMICYSDDPGVPKWIPKTSTHHLWVEVLGSKNVHRIPIHEIRVHHNLYMYGGDEVVLGVRYTMRKESLIR